MQPSFPKVYVRHDEIFVKSSIIHQQHRKNLEGKVIVKFYVDIDGTIKNPVVLKDGVGGGDYSCEAIRIVKVYAKMDSRNSKGKPVKVYLRFANYF
ncbi:MAG: energy transducer TonB [Saprospirales bacterium]|nr:energy transducer TonB [Saprospirales bacterium]